MSNVKDKIKKENYKMNKIKIDDLEVDNNIYPRRNLSDDRIKSYQEALKAGAKFPPILVQKIIDDEGEKVIVLDGVHRITAYKNEKHEEIDVTHWKDKVLDKRLPEVLEQLRIVSTQKNLEHGVPLTEGDIGFQCKRIVEDMSIEKLTGVQKYLAEKFGVTEGYVSKLIGVLVNSRKASRDSIIIKLSMLGWNQEDISGVVGIKQSAISQIINKFLGKEINNSFNQGKTIGDIASYYSIDQTLVWAIISQGRTDKERIKLLSEKMHDFTCEILPYDVWPSSTLLIQLLFFYTKQGNLVIDPVAGSGQMVDICLLMNRQCKAYDVDPPDGHKDIQQESDVAEAIKKLKKKADMFFLNFPYFRDKEKENNKKSVSGLSRGYYLDHLKILADSCKEKLAPNGKVALLVSDQVGDDPCNSIFIDSYIRLFREADFVVDRIIQCPQSIDQIHPDIINECINSLEIYSIARYLVIFRGANPCKRLLTND